MAPRVLFAFAPLPNFSNQYEVLGSWLIDDTPCGLSIREDENPTTGNTSPVRAARNTINPAQRAPEATILNAVRTVFGR